MTKCVSNCLCNFLVTLLCICIVSPLFEMPYRFFFCLFKEYKLYCNKLPLPVNLRVFGCCFESHDRFECFLSARPLLFQDVLIFVCSSSAKACAAILLLWHQNRKVVKVLFVREGFAFKSEWGVSEML